MDVTRTRSLAVSHAAVCSQKEQEEIVFHKAFAS